MKKISLIILTFNSEKDIYDCLYSVYQHNDIGESLEIIVVDNNSHDYAQMHKKISALYPNVIIIPNKENGGYGQGNNIGINIASAPIVAIMNPDVRLVMPVFSEILHTLRKESNIMCGGKQLFASGEPATSFVYDHHSPALYQSIGTILHKRLDKYDYRRMWLSGAFFAIKKKEFTELGLFDERIFMYGEEFDIHLRIRKYFPSKKIIYLPKLYYLHLIEDREITKDYIHKQLYSDMLICKRHNISTQKFLRRKIRTLQIMRCINRITCWIKGAPYNPAPYELREYVIKELNNM